MNLIDKDALVAEIKKRIQEHLDAGGATSGVYLSERMKEDSYLLSFIDTLDISGKIDKEQPIEGLENGGKHYCPDCYELDEEDHYHTKDGRVWDAETEEEITK